MKAVLSTDYGPTDSLKLEEIQKPVPGDDDVLVKVQAASVTYSNLMLVTGKPFVGRLFTGLFKPNQNRLGSDVAGRVEAVGKNVHQFQPGDEVYGDLSDYGRGTFAEFVCAPATALARKPRQSRKRRWSPCRP